MENVWLATDLSQEAVLPWAHALRICASSATDLRVLHVTNEQPAAWSELPTARTLLTAWGYLDGDATVDDFERLGFKIHLRSVEAKHPAGLLGAMVEVHAPDLLVLGTHRPTGGKRLLEGSISEEIARQSPMATLILPDGCKPFVDPNQGTCSLRRVLIPVGETGAQRAVDAVTELIAALDPGPVEYIYLHVGPVAEIPQLKVPERPGFTHRTVNYPDGNVVGRVLEAAIAQNVDLVSMATHGHDSWWDSLLGSRTERVLRDAHTPVLITLID